MGTELSLGGRRHDVTAHPLVMGILNRTRDSFYDGGRHFRLDALLRRAESMVGDGADILDVGARPGGVGVRDVPLLEECDLVVETVTALRERFDAPVSVDTTRAAVAEAAFAHGAVLGNDMSGFGDPGYLPAAARHGASVVATHTRLPPGIPDPDPVYGDVVGDVAAHLRHLAQRCWDAGLPAHRVILDPGLDLGKTWRQSLRLLAAIGRFARPGHPVLLAASNKIFLGRLLGLDTGERGAASTAAVAVGVLRGAGVIRAHDVRAARHAADLCAAVLAADARPEAWNR
ncbi:dihydropteroate synthase [Spinactinospora alkalitolerans]|uniref:Dihydropteroate synthase n=1 Tax=Spinactinospora alkalitolerans TaxID=687207 RepID=A0A852TSP5_9ACTN|nr:dihydropteroate synthase [Spinactinospora alkalitolerans]NYE47039.1 dihydropteroate synthase [Spinactinospora alkalitolerans]